MARCGCTEKCSCIIKDGICTSAGLDVTPGGCGDSTSLSSVDVVADGQTIVCGANGLEANFTTLDTNTVDLEGAGTPASPLEAHVIRTPDANVPDPDGLGGGNLLKELPGAGGGIYVSCEDVQDCVGSAINKINVADCLEYNDATNTISLLICVEPNGLECAPVGAPGCPTGGLLVIPSSDPGDTLTFGTDNRLFAPATAIIPGDCMSFTGTGTPADPFVISPLIAPEPNGVECVPGQGLLVFPSADAGNTLTFGGDQRLFAPRCPLLNAGSQILVGNTGPCFELVGGADCVTPMVATLRISDDPCNGLSCGADGLYVQDDLTDLPQALEVRTAFGPFGPFNGAFNAPLPGGNIGIVVEGPTCLTITNPSTCRDMITAGIVTGFADTGRTSGAFRLAFDVSATGAVGPWFSVSQMGQSNPQPASRFTSNAIHTGDEFTIGPGASRTICTRLVFNTSNLNVVNARIFSGERTFTLRARWTTE